MHSTEKELCIEYRSAKVTPKKIGQFVTLYKRVKDSPILPYDAEDGIDFVVVDVKTKNHSGQFVFPKDVLIENGIFSVKQQGGKRASRLYLPWDLPQSLQAKKSQKWQIHYFKENRPLSKKVYSSKKALMSVIGTRMATMIVPMIKPMRMIKSG